MVYLNKSKEIPASDKFHSSYFEIIDDGSIVLYKPVILTGVENFLLVATAVNDWAMQKKNNKHAMHAG